MSIYAVVTLDNKQDNVINLNTHSNLRNALSDVCDPERYKQPYNMTYILSATGGINSESLEDLILKHIDADIENNQMFLGQDVVLTENSIEIKVAVGGIILSAIPSKLNLPELRTVVDNLDEVSFDITTESVLKYARSIYK